MCERKKYSCLSNSSRINLRIFNICRISVFSLCLQTLGYWVFGQVEVYFAPHSCHVKPPHTNTLLRSLLQGYNTHVVPKSSGIYRLTSVGSMYCLVFVGLVLGTWRVSVQCIGDMACLCTMYWGHGVTLYNVLGTWRDSVQCIGDMACLCTMYCGHGVSLYNVLWTRRVSVQCIGDMACLCTMYWGHGVSLYNVLGTWHVSVQCIGDMACLCTMYWGHGVSLYNVWETY
jgi:hypothetical protein